MIEDIPRSRLNSQILQQSSVEATASTSSSTSQIAALGSITNWVNLKDNEFALKAAQFQLQSVARQLLPEARVKHCLRRVFDKFSAQETAQISGREIRDNGQYHNDPGIISKSYFPEPIYDTSGVDPRYSTPGVIDLNRKLFRKVQPPPITHTVQLAPISDELRTKMEHFGKVRIFTHHETSKAYFAGLAVCGSIWNCPVCAAKITERRRSEMTLLLDYALKAGYHVSLMTLTAPHQHNDSLEDLITRFSKARGYLKNRKVYKRFSKVYGVIGTVRALEVTHGVAGWHVHTHELIIHKRPNLPGPNVAIYEDDFVPIRVSARLPTLAHAWQDACASAEYIKLPTVAAGVDIRGGDAVASYVTKWGLAHEVTKSHTKSNAKQKTKGKTPFDLLRSVFDTSSVRDGKLFREYAGAFFGRRQIYLSTGLRDRIIRDYKVTLTPEELAAFNAAEAATIFDKSDGELAESEVTDKDLFLASLDQDTWKMFLDYEDKRTRHSARAALLKTAEIVADAEAINIDTAIDGLLSVMRREIAATTQPLPNLLTVINMLSSELRVYARSNIIDPSVTLETYSPHDHILPKPIPSPALSKALETLIASSIRVSRRVPEFINDVC